MPTPIIYDADTGAILVVDPQLDAEGNVILPVGTNAEVMELSDQEAVKLEQPGSYRVDQNGVVTVTPPVPDPPDVVERQTARTDIEAQYDNAMTRLNDIVANGPTYTQAQSRDALVDLARTVRRTVRYIHAEMT